MVPRDDFPAPAMRLVRQRFDRSELPEFRQVLAERVRSRLADLAPAQGSTVAIGVGSRGISPIVSVLETLIAELRSAGASPFIVPAMGSHGGGTAEGQAGVLAEYGIDEDTLGVPVRATMDTVEIGRTASGAVVHLDAAAAAADGIVVIGRVKPHTSFRGPVESGLSKMLVIGFGNRAGAESIHAHPLAETIPTAAEVAVAQADVWFGVALVENAFDRPYSLEVVEPERFLETDRRLLEIANEVLPRIPLDRLDLLIVDRIGKNISGTGMDPNVIGMWRRLPELEREPDYGWIAALGLTDATHGNAVGIGMASMVSQKLVDAYDPAITAANVLTSMGLHLGNIPLTLPTDREAFDTGLWLARRTTGTDPRVGRIANTLELETFWLSEPAVPDLPDSCEVVEPAGEFGFAADGSIIEPAAFDARG